MSYAFDYVHKNGGIDTDEDYSYWSVDLACQTAKQGNRHMVSIDGYEEVPKNDTQALLKAVSNQPVSVGICANSNLQFYSSGVVDEPSCCSQMNHGVLVVGFENDGPQRHWKIKNSWGTGASGGRGGGFGQWRLLWRPMMRCEAAYSFLLMRLCRLGRGGLLSCGHGCSGPLGDVRPAANASVPCQEDCQEPGAL